MFSASGNGEIVRETIRLALTFWNDHLINFLEFQFYLVNGFVSVDSQARTAIAKKRSWHIEEISLT